MRNDWWETPAFILGIVVALGIAVTGVGGVYYAWKHVQVWGAEQSGRAVLAEAEFSRQVRVEEAQARADAAALEGQAELTRAEFAARANRELAEGLGGPEAYLRYLYIRMLEESSDTGQIIYIPTEGAMPILEAGRALE